MAALIGALRVSLSADTAQFQSGMRRAERQAQASASSIGKSLGIMKAGIAGLVSGLSLSLFVNVVKGALDYAGSLGEVSQQLGVTTTDLQTFRYAAGQNGVSTEALDKGLGKLTITLGQVAAGAKAPTAALNAIGISAAQLKGKDTGEAFRIIADGLKNVTDRSQRAAVEVALFGRAGAQLDTLLSGGSERINELADAANRLGIVLSDDQIARADETADKLDALKTVLSARIAGVVADNADAILGLANALADLVGSIGSALTAWANFRAQMNAGLLQMQGLEQAAARARGSAFVSDRNPTVPGKSVTIALGPAKKPKPVAPVGSDVGRFLDHSGGGKPKRARAAREDHSAERALTDAHRFDQDIRRAQIDILNATRDLSTDAIERYKISVDIKDAEKAVYDADLAYQVKLNELSKGQDGITAAQAQQLKLQHDRVDQLERDKLKADEDHRAFEDSARLDDLQFDLARDRLQSEGQLAETAKDQRDVQLRLLDLSYQQERARLQSIEADTQASEAAKEEARRRLANLNQTYGNDRQAVIQNTRGPMEQFHAQFSDISEELEQLQVDGINAAASIAASFDGSFKSLRDNALQALQQIASEFLRLQLLKSAANMFGGGPAAGAAQGGAQLQAAGATLTTAGGTLNAAGGSLTAAGGTLTASGAPLNTAGLELNTAGTMLNASALAWTVTAAEISAAAGMLMAASAANAASSSASSIAGAAGSGVGPASLMGFAGGGWTGNIPVNRPAGIVHGREYVFDAAATARLGVPFLESLRTDNISLPRVPASSRVSLNDNEIHGRSRGDTIVNMEVRTPDANSFNRSRRQTQRDLKRRVGI